MKWLYFLLISIIPAFCQGQAVKSFKQTQEGVEVTLGDGMLGIYPIADNAMRIQYYTGKEISLPEMIFTQASTVPGFKVVDAYSKLEVKVGNFSAILDKLTGNLSYINQAGVAFLTEKAGTRKLTADSVMGEACFEVEQSFESPADEHIFGLGQFQDGYNNIKGITRRLIQVNSQIAIPFLYSDRGYGLLWHQYGLTDFNPAGNFITLEKQQQPAGNNKTAEVTTTSGTQAVSQNQSLYTGKFVVPEDGSYCLFLDLGDMGNRHLIVIDGHPCVDQSNMWLPPAIGALVHLKSGEHQVQVLCKSNNTPALSWRLADNTTTFRSPHAQGIDYVVFYGPSADEVIASYRKLSGNAPMFPQWAYGFWQCRERYTSGISLVETVQEFRKRNLPVDVIVQDWQYWGNMGWGVPLFDTVNYPNPAGFIKELHDLHAHFNISIWSNPDRNSALGKEYMAKNRFIPGTKWLDYFNPETRNDYWNTLNQNMFINGIDSWWMDAVEPENDALHGQRTCIGPGDFYRLTYPLMVSQAVYEGQRSTTSDKRVCILTRSAFPGQQRYGIINWSGDIGGTWDSYRRQIVAGLGYAITGMPYWTTDIGGFFRPGNAQYTDEKYQELLTRWFQWGVFNPIFRVHGYQSETEPWKYGQITEANIARMLRLRYKLMPYIYSGAWQVTSGGSTLMRPLVMDFNGDIAAMNRPFEYMFGKALLVAPITEPNTGKWNVYLPESASWYDFWTGAGLKGGQTVATDAPLDQIPLFVKAGSILPVGPDVQYATEKKWEDLEIRVYQGADGSFVLYEDEGDNYDYEKGVYSTITLSWDDAHKTLTLGERKGLFPGMLQERKFRIVRVGVNKGAGMEATSKPDRIVVYNGKKLVVKL